MLSADNGISGTPFRTRRRAAKAVYNLFRYPWQKRITGNVCSGPPYFHFRRPPVCRAMLHPETWPALLFYRMQHSTGTCGHGRQKRKPEKNRMVVQTIPRLCYNGPKVDRRRPGTSNWLKKAVLCEYCLRLPRPSSRGLPLFWLSAASAGRIPPWLRPSVRSLCWRFPGEWSFSRAPSPD